MISNIVIVISLCVCALSQYLNEDEGARCTWKGVSGTCVHIFQCESSPLLVKNKDYPPICMFNGKEPVICCTDCNTVQDTRKIIFNTHVGILLLNGQKSNDKCVNYIDKLDYGCKINRTFMQFRVLDPTYNCYLTGSGELGSPSSGERIRREPYLALLGYGEDMEMAQWLCSGAVISERFIVTAAHCLNNRQLGLVKFLALGIKKRTDPPELWQRYSVKRNIPHPEYRLPSKYNDIALLETETEIRFSKDILPACLHSDPSTDIQNAQILSRGAEGKDLGSLIPVTLNIFDSMLCSILYPPHEYMKQGFNDSTQLCYGEAERPKDSCLGDSGGPLIATSQAAGCASILLGITSTNRICGSAGSSGMFTKIIHYVPWIESIVWP